MGRREKPLDDGPLREFAEDLRALRVQAGNPTYRELSRKAMYSVSALAAATSGQMLPTLEVTLAYVRACGGDVEAWRGRWEDQRDLLNRTNPSLLPPEERTAAGAGDPGQPPAADPYDSSLPDSAGTPTGSGADSGETLEPERIEGLERGEPRKVGRFRLHGRLGGGAMGVVYLGSSPAGRPVAVKVIRPEYARDSMFRQRFAHEVAAARKVTGGQTPAVVDADAQADPPWLATEFVPGPSLGETVAVSGPLAEPVVWGLAAGIAEALAAIHAAGVVHRDLKPANILLDRDGPKVIDFGICRAVDGTSITSPGIRVGTVGYTSPEQAERGISAPAGDVFALGAVLAFAASGVGAFGTGSDAEVLYRIVHEPPVPQALACKDKKLRALIESCLSKDPDSRPTVGQIIAAAAEAGIAAGPGPALPAGVAARIAARSHDAADLLAHARTARRVRIGLAPLMLVLAIVTVTAIASQNSSSSTRGLQPPPPIPTDQVPPSSDSTADSGGPTAEPSSDSPQPAAAPSSIALPDQPGPISDSPITGPGQSSTPGPGPTPTLRPVSSPAPGPVSSPPPGPVSTNPPPPPSPRGPVDFSWGPGCPGTNDTGYGAEAGNWSTIPTDDYTGSGCSGLTDYILNTDTSAKYEWTFPITNPGATCQIYAYIPTKNAGTYATRYDFLVLDYGKNTWRWIGWPGQDINQENASGWYPIAKTMSMPQGTAFKITVSDDTAKDTQRRYLAAGDMHLTCT